MKSQSPCSAQTNREAGQHFSQIAVLESYIASKADPEQMFDSSYSCHSASTPIESSQRIAWSLCSMLCLHLGGILRPHLTLVGRLGALWQLWPSEQLLFVTVVLVPAGLGLEPKMEFYS